MAEPPSEVEQTAQDESLPPRVGESLKYALECPVCLEYMQPPIIMCQSGHNVCRDCRLHLTTCPICRQPLTGTRNVALENLAREFIDEFPAREPGTPRPLPAVHLDTSDYEDLHGCPMQCQWSGKRVELRAHMLDSHKDKVLDGEDFNRCGWKLPLIVRDSRVIFAFGEVFRYYLRLHTIKKLFYIAVQFIGPPGDAEKYMFEAEIVGDRKMIAMGYQTMKESIDLDAAFESGNCVVLDYETVKNAGNNLVYSINLIYQSR